MFDRLSERWDASPLLQLVAPVLCVAWEAMLFTRLFFIGLPGSPSPSLLLSVLLLLALGCAALFVRHRWPLAVALAEAMSIALLSLMDVTSETGALALVAAYACVARGSQRDALEGTTAIVVAQAFACTQDVMAPTGGAAVGGTASTWGFMLTYVVFLSPTILTIALGAISRLRYDRRRARQAEAAAERARAEELARVAEARDAALRRGRIAAELHDSVGHDLTAIVALSEGLAGTTGDDELDRALASINGLARAGLEDTRRAVRALAGARDAKSAGAAMTGPASDAAEAPHRWDEVEPVLEHVRELGITCALTETGTRPDDARQADLAFSITREALTNAVRHGGRASGGHVGRIVTSWDHRPDGTLALTVRDDGERTAGTPCTAAGGGNGAKEGGRGTGLVRLEEVVRLSGGTFSSGYEDNAGWTVHATIPSQAVPGHRLPPGGKGVRAHDTHHDRR